MQLGRRIDGERLIRTRESPDGLDLHSKYVINLSFIGYIILSFHGS